MRMIPLRQRHVSQDVALASHCAYAETESGRPEPTRAFRFTALCVPPQPDWPALALSSRFPADCVQLPREEQQSKLLPSAESLDYRLQIVHVPNGRSYHYWKQLIPTVAGCAHIRQPLTRKTSFIHQDPPCIARSSWSGLVVHSY
jgi:hypothetical protein